MPGAFYPVCSLCNVVKHWFHQIAPYSDYSQPLASETTSDLRLSKDAIFPAVLSVNPLLLTNVKPGKNTVTNLSPPCNFYDLSFDPANRSCRCKKLNTFERFSKHENYSRDSKKKTFRRVPNDGKRLHHCVCVCLDHFRGRRVTEKGEGGEPAGREEQVRGRSVESDYVSNRTLPIPINREIISGVERARMM